MKFRAQGCQGSHFDAQGHILSWLVGDVSLPHDLLDPADVVQLCQGMSGSHTVACALAGVHIIMEMTVTVSAGDARSDESPNARLKLTPFLSLRGPQSIEWESQYIVL